MEALLLAASCDAAVGRVFNLGGDRVVSLKKLADLLIEINGGGEYFSCDFPVDRKRIDIGDFYADYDCINSSLGWQPKTPLGEGLKRTLAFYREHLDQYV